jgi:hypothetical protein
LRGPTPRAVRRWFLHGLWLLPSSWDRWATVFEENGCAALMPGWPDDPETVAEANAHPEVLVHKRNGGISEFVKIPGRGHGLTIDRGWCEVADPHSASLSASSSRARRFGQQRRRRPTEDGGVPRDGRRRRPVSSDAVNPRPALQEGEQRDVSTPVPSRGRPWRETWSEWAGRTTGGVVTQQSRRWLGLGGVQGGV